MVTEAYKTKLGTMYQGLIEDFLDIKGKKYKGKAQLVFFSPPFPLNRKKAYGNLTGDAYRLSWKTGTALARHLAEHFGLVYRNYLRSLEIFVQSRRVSPVDPLLLMEDGRFYDLDADRAEALPSQVIKVKTEAHGEVEMKGCDP